MDRCQKTGDGIPQMDGGIFLHRLLLQKYLYMGKSGRPLLLFYTRTQTLPSRTCHSAHAALGLLPVHEVTAGQHTPFPRLPRGRPAHCSPP